MQERLYLNNFNKGLVAYTDKRMLELGACSDGSNTRFNENTIRIREGRTYHADLPGDVGDATMLFEYHRAGASQQELITGFGDDDGPGMLLARGDKLYYASNEHDQSVFEEITGMTLNTGQRTRAAQYKELVYVVDGYSAVRSWSPNGGINELTDNAKSLTKPTIISVEGEVRTLADCASGEITGAHTGYRRVSGTFPTVDKDINAANAVRWYAQPMRGVTGYEATEWRGTYMRRFITLADEDTVVKPMIGLEMVVNPTGITGTFDLRARAVMNLNAEIANNILPKATMIEVRYKVICGGSVMPAVKLQFGTTDPALGIESATPDLDLSATLPAGTVNTWETAIVNTIDLGTPEVLKTMKYMTLDVDCMVGVTPTDRVEVDSTKVDYPTFATGVTVLIDYIAVDVADSKFTPGAEYEFCYLYKWVDGEITTQSEASPVSDIFKIGGTVYNSTMAANITFDVLPEADFGADGFPDSAVIYARGGSIGKEFRLINDYTLTGIPAGGTTLSVTWDGVFSGEELNNVIPVFTPAPIEGCSNIMEHRGRMVYAKGDVLFLSNWDAPDKVPGEGSIAQSSTDGTWVRVGLDGSPIVGLGKLGSYLVIFKARSTWMLEGDDLTTFTLVQLSDSHGCSSHESIAQVDGSMLVWRDGEHIWSWNGQQFNDLGMRIQNLLKTHTVAQQVNSVGCYNPAEKIYLLSVPGATGLTANIYSFELAAGCWNTVWTLQPGHSLCYAQTVKIQGLYAVDVSGVYRLFAGTVDAISDSVTQAIAFNWVSGMIELPTVGRYKDVRAIHAVLSDAVNNLLLVDFTLGVNGSPTIRTSKSDVKVKPLAGSPGVATWQPQALSDVDSYAVGVGGSSSTGGEIVRIEMSVGVRGVSR